MRITAFNGSPKAERGNTNVMVEAFLAGAREAGAEIENVFLSRKKIGPCKACNACWMKTPGRCAQRDDMDELLEKFAASDVVVFATPVYVDNVTGLMKNFMDRLIPIADAHWEKDENGECRHVRRHDKPAKIAVISNCGFPQQSHFQVLRLLFRRLSRNIHAEVIAEIYREAGALLSAPAPDLQSLVSNYREVLRKAGREVVEHSRLSAATAAELERPLLPSGNFVDEYMKLVNQRCDDILKKLDA
ncbi:MAG: flavodoxin family protein [Candidatus Krumholzibacteria bacterium]|nr:flavodoxin family protein [Candidatus Krumholzibacteria bacterium]